MFMTKIKCFLSSFFLFAVLDAIWLGFVTKDVYMAELAPIARLKDGNFDIVYWSAFIVYVFLGLGVVFFVLDMKQRTPIKVFLRGAFFGLLTYGVYDMTNVTTLKDYTVKIALLDMAWGAVACALVSTITFLLLRDDLKS